MSYNALLTTLEINIVVKPIVPAIIVKLTLPCINCGKTNHLVETCHNRKREVLVVPTTTFKSTKPIARTKTQLVKSRKIHVHYPCIIYFNVEHKSGECPKKIEVRNMFKTKLVGSNVTQHLNHLKLTMC